MSIGTGIAITGIWIGVGICSFSAGSAIISIVGTACFATLVTALFS